MDRRTTVFPGAILALVLVVTGCSSGDDSADTPPSAAPSASGASGLAYSPHSVGFGEAMNTAGGAHRVLSMTNDATSTAVQAEDGSRLVAALVEECASARGAVVASSDGWSVVTSPQADPPITSPVELQPTSAGAPSVGGSREIDADSCAMGDVVFDVPDDLTVLGFHYQRDGSRTASWIKTPG